MNVKKSNTSVPYRKERLSRLKGNEKETREVERHENLAMVSSRSDGKETTGRTEKGKYF